MANEVLLIASALCVPPRAHDAHRTSSTSVAVSQRPALDLPAVDRIHVLFQHSCQRQVWRPNRSTRAAGSARCAHAVFMHNLKSWRAVCRAAVAMCRRPGRQEALARCC